MKYINDDVIRIERFSKKRYETYKKSRLSIVVRTKTKCLSKAPTSIVDKTTQTATTPIKRTAAPNTRSKTASCSSTSVRGSRKANLSCEQ